MYIINVSSEYEEMTNLIIKTFVLGISLFIIYTYISQNVLIYIPLSILIQILSYYLIIRYFLVVKDYSSK